MIFTMKTKYVYLFLSECYLSFIWTAAFLAIVKIFVLKQNCDQICKWKPSI